MVSAGVRLPGAHAGLGEVGPGWVGPGLAGSGTDGLARQGKGYRRVAGRHRGSSPRHPRKEWLGTAGRGTAWRGLAGPGWARQGMAGDRQASGFEPLTSTHGLA
jgi:hypothetical protein